MSILDNPHVERREANTDLPEDDERRYGWNVNVGEYPAAEGRQGKGYSVAYDPTVNAWIVFNCYMVWVGSDRHFLAPYGRRPELTAGFETAEAAVSAVLSA